jgi:NADH-quinone oxidoreductase subunit G
MRAAFPPGDARDDWSILRALSGALGRKLPFDSLTELRTHLVEVVPHFGEVDAIRRAAPDDIVRLANLGGSLSGPAFASPVRDFYLTNPIARASRVMAECSALHLGPAAQAAE